MTTSGNTAISSNENRIIRGALRLLGFRKNLGAGSGEDIINCREMLNEMISNWQADGIGLWLNKEVTLFLGYETASYNIGSTGGNATLTSYETALAEDGSEDDSTITVDDDDDITDGDYIGIQLDDTTMQWTTVDGTPASNVVTLDTALTGDASEDNVVYNYTTKALRPLEIIEVRLNNSSGNDHPINIVSREEYFNISDKTASGTPYLIYYDPQLTNAKIYVYPTSNSVENQIKFTAKYPVEIFEAYDDEPQFPQEWLLALKYNLAALLIPEYADTLTGNQISLILSQATTLKDKLMIFDSDHNASIYFQPDID